MALLRSAGPYVWVSWINKLLVGEAACEWGAWFKAQHEGHSWEKVPSDFDQVQWLLKHVELLEQTRMYYERQGYMVTLDSQNSFVLRGHTATLAGKPDLVATRDNEVVVVDVKVGQTNPANTAQVMLYLYALPRAFKTRFEGTIMSGQVVYPEGPVEVPGEAVDESFVSAVGTLMRRLGNSLPPRKVPSWAECRYCSIGPRDCLSRVEAEETPMTGITEDF
ncbi:MAG: Dna2/Cas4 domain-containing protein [Chloroflexi bacterium]|nr:Dna2/Cas4 domain-containing protein [Chloroflexota bacterium]